MFLLYRVLTFLPGAAPDAVGGALYIPPQGGGRLDNPELYSVLYLSDAASGAIAEAFGRFPEWSPAMLAGSPGLELLKKDLDVFRKSMEPVFDWSPQEPPKKKRPGSPATFSEPIADDAELGTIKDPELRRTLKKLLATAARKGRK